jgi:DNA polymerase III alpha subunit
MQDQHLPELTKYIALDVDQKTFDGALQSEWFMPDEYKTLNVHNYVLTKCNTQEETARCAEELAEFEGRGMKPLLQYMIYLVDFMRENDIVWGVGRGSSVASYVLYLIGVHKIDSIKYELDWREFLR